METEEGGRQRVRKTQQQGNAIDDDTAFSLYLSLCHCPLVVKCTFMEMALRAGMCTCVQVMYSTLHAGGGVYPQTQVCLEISAKTQRWRFT